MTADVSKYPQKKFNDKGCRWCSVPFSPLAPSHLYCSDECKDNGLANNYYKKQYGFSLEGALKLLEDQENLCAICRKVGFKMREDVKNPLNLDHCHSTGKVRGFLCHNCNRGLGLFQDSPEFLRAAALYLEGATTIPQGSTLQAIGSGSAQRSEMGDDIVCSAGKLAAVEETGQE